MTADLQGILEKINRDGLEKAKKDADEILAKAKKDAAAILAAAKEESARLKAEGAKSAADDAVRAKESVAQAARDAMLRVEAGVTAMLERLFAKNVEAALADPATLSALVRDALNGLMGPGEIVVAPKLAEALRAALAAEKDFRVITDDGMDTGFSVRLEGGRVEHDFTGPAVAAELARRLRPDLAALLK